MTTEIMDRAAPDAGDQILVYDLAMRLQQIENGLPSTDTWWLGMVSADDAHPLHHRAFEFVRLQWVVKSLELDRNALSPQERADAFNWKYRFYPKTITNEQLADAIAKQPRHSNETLHRVAALTNALEDSEAAMQFAQDRFTSPTALGISRAAARGASVMAGVSRELAQIQQAREQRLRAAGQPIATVSELPSFRAIATPGDEAFPEALADRIVPIELAGPADVFRVQILIDSTLKQDREVRQVLSELRGVLIESGYDLDGERLVERQVLQQLIAQDAQQQTAADRPRQRA
jgi:hypothetical protein